jgi:hypothetical protein
MYKSKENNYFLTDFNDNSFNFEQKNANYNQLHLYTTIYVNAEIQSVLLRRFKPQRNKINLDPTPQEEIFIEMQ